MKIGLIDVDSHNWPNLCLMKLSAYHKARGDLVEWGHRGFESPRPHALGGVDELQ